MNILRRELKANRKSLLIWCICAILLILIGMGKYSGLSNSNTQLNQLVNEMPKAFRALMGMGEFDLSTILGYYGVLFAYLMLMAGIYAVSLGAIIIAKEERDKTTEFLITKPVLRSSILTAKLMVVLINMVIFNLVILVAGIAGQSLYTHPANSTAYLLQMALGLFFFQLIFAALGAALAGSFKNSKQSSAIGTYILLITYLLSSIMGFFDNVNFLRFFTPFRYFDTAKILKGGGIEWLFVVLSLVITGLLLVITYRSYEKRDLGV